ncbi:unnamed protein product [Allacma fusca]|uniref:Uncharacterized protein n=1 Tax=Allacma fusca TaxID=39272 RepID=A0A8J2LT67_9HEXA|nr:unnamed protein product [Allacma fusca]
MVGLLIFMVWSHQDARHYRQVRRYQIFKTSNSIYQDHHDNDNFLEIYFGIGILIALTYMAVDVLLFIAAILRSRRSLYVWLFLTVATYIGGIILICLLFTEWSWMNFLLIIILTILKIWGFTIVLMFIAEIKTQELKVKGDDSFKHEETQTQQSSSGRHLVIEVKDTDEKRKAMDIVSKFSQNPDSRNILIAKHPSKLSPT